MKNGIKRKLTESFFIILSIILFLCFTYYYTGFKYTLGSDDGLQFHTSKNLILLNELNPTSIPPQIIYSFFLCFLEPLNFLNFYIIINIIFLILTSYYIYLITLFLFDKKTALFTFFLFLLTSSVNSSYILRLTPYIIASFFATGGLYYFLRFQKIDLYLGKSLNYMIISAIFLISAILSRRIWQLFLIIIGIYSLIKILLIYNTDRKKFKIIFFKFFYFFLFCFIIFFPILIWKINLLGKYFYIDEYTWFFDKEILEYANSLNPSLNPPFSIKSLVDYFQNIAYRFYPFLTVLLIPWIFLNKNFKEDKNLLEKILILALFLIFLLVPVFSQGVRSFDRYAHPGFFGFVLLLSANLLLFIKPINTKILKIFIIFIIFIMILVHINTFYEKIFLYFERADNNREEYFNDTSILFEKINDTGGNVLFRSYFIEPFLPSDMVVYSLFNLERSDAINYLLWRNDEEVIKSLEKYNIKWVFIYNKETHLEEEYYGWTDKIYGESPNYLKNIQNSTHFKKIFSGKQLDVYQILADEFK